MEVDESEKGCICKYLLQYQIFADVRYRVWPRTESLKQYNTCLLHLQVNHSSLRHLRQQTRHTINPLLLLVRRHRIIPDLWTNRTSFPELDEQTVEVRPFPVRNLSNHLSNVSAGIVEDELVDADPDLPEVPMPGCDGLKCHGDPFGALISAVKLYISESRCLRKIDQRLHRIAYK